MGHPDSRQEIHRKNSNTPGDFSDLNGRVSAQQPLSRVSNVVDQVPSHGHERSVQAKQAYSRHSSISAGSSVIVCRVGALDQPHWRERPLSLAKTFQRQFLTGI